MRSALAFFAACFLTAIAAAQAPPVQSQLLDHLAGHWVLRGIVHGQSTTHDVQADWVIKHHHLRIHEISREKDASGQPQYEAIVFVGFDPKANTFSCVWLDDYGAVGRESIGIAVPAGNEIPFVFRDANGDESFRNTFVYDPKSDTWEWVMDNVLHGAVKPFARLKLSRP